jgi:hypothetical protein
MRTVLRLPFGVSMRLLFATMLAAGCSRGPTASESVEQNLRHLGVAYEQTSKKTGRVPRGAEDLQPALQRLGDPRTLLVSPNDGQPFIIHWGVPIFRPGPQKGVFPILAHEAVGVGGKKYVLDNMLSIRQMTEAELDHALQANQ